MDKTQYFVTAAPGYYGDKTVVLSTHCTVIAARKAAGVGYSVRFGSASKGDAFLRVDEVAYPLV